MIDWTKISMSPQIEFGNMTPEERAAWEKEEAENYNEYMEVEAKMNRCTYHIAPGYTDPEGDGCPECGWGAK